jgi:protein O-mannosyl-transferase
LLAFIHPSSFIPHPLLMGRKRKKTDQGGATAAAKRTAPPAKRAAAARLAIDQRRATWQVLLAVGLIVLAGLAAYANSFGGPFIYDDQASIPENDTIRKLWPLTDVLRPPAAGETVSGRPVLNLSFALNYALDGTKAGGYHAVNLLIHILAGLALFGIVRRTLGWKGEGGALAEPVARGGSPRPALSAATWLACGVAVLWVVHPLGTEAVTYIVQRAESLAALFYLLTLYCFIRGAQCAAQGGQSHFPADASHLCPKIGTVPHEPVPPRPSSPASRPLFWYAAAVAACLLGMATKEVVATLPLVVLLYDRAFLSGSLGAALRRRWPLYAALAASWTLLAYLVLSTGLLIRSNVLQPLDSIAYACTQPEVIVHYLRLCFWPAPLCLDYEWPLVHTVREMLPWAAALAVPAAVAIWGLVGNKRWAVPAVCFFLILAPTSSFLPLGQAAFEHRMYLSLAAAIILVVMGGRWVFGRAAQLGWLPGVAATALGGGLVAAVCVLLVVTTLLRNQVYSSAVSIWQDTVDKAPYNPRAHNNLGAALLTDARLDEAIVQYREAVRLFPPYADAHANLGGALLREKRFAEAREQFSAAMHYKPDLYQAHTDLARLCVAEGRKEEALAHFEEANRIKPHDPAVLKDLWLMSVELQKLEVAESVVRELAELEPQDAEWHSDLGKLCRAAGRKEESLQRFQEVNRLRPHNLAVLKNIWQTSYELKRLDVAEAAARELAALEPAAIAWRNNLGMVLAGEGRGREAIDQWQTALKLSPDDPLALNSLAWLLATSRDAALRNGREAVALAQRAVEVSQRADPGILDTLAAAYAEAGRFPDAIKTAAEAETLASKQGKAALAKKLQARLELYRKGSAFRESGP